MASKSPRVSVLIPSYNHARFLAECVGSVQGQTFEDWEVILVDDCSQDDSVAIASELANHDERIAVHQNTSNMGTYGTLQRALDLSNGDYVAVLNSDDVWKPEKLSAQVSALDAHPECSFAITRGWMVDDSGVIDETNDVHADWPSEDLADLLPWLLMENRVLASSVLFRRARLTFDASARYSGDWLALLRQVLLGQAYIVPERLTLWRQHSHNTYTRSANQVEEEIAMRLAIDEASELWLAKTPGELAAQKLAHNLVNLHALFILVGDRTNAGHVIKRAHVRFPNDPLVKKRYLLSKLPLQIQRMRLWKGERMVLPAQRRQFEIKFG